jgi:hypothetical protein
MAFAPINAVTELDILWITAGFGCDGDAIAMKKALSAAATVAGVATLAFAGYVLLVSLPNFRRYIKISTM